jgi:hypothetical protein
LFSTAIFREESLGKKERMLPWRGEGQSSAAGKSYAPRFSQGLPSANTGEGDWEHLLNRIRKLRTPSR